MAELREIIDWADAFLRVDKIVDYPNALNGLQLENSGRVTKIAAAVDCSTRALREAAARGADLLVVHHGIFWNGLRPIAGALARQIRMAFARDLAVYSVHLPLDLHPEIGNNVLLMSALGIENSAPFFEERGSLLGRAATAEVALADLAERLRGATGAEVRSFAFGPKMTRRIGVITGGAGGEIERVARERVDTFITGEGPHWAAVAAQELEVNLLLGGHYATETFGVKALARTLAEKFQLQWEFIDLPTGL